MAPSKTSAVRLKASERRARAFRLRLAGAKFREIGQQLGCTEQRAHQIITDEIARISEKCTELAEQVRTLELERLDVLQMGCWRNATQGNLGSVDRVLRIMERRAKLLGLDAPDQVQLQGGEHGIAAMIAMAQDPDLYGSGLDDLPGALPREATEAPEPMLQPRPSSENKTEDR